MLPLKKKCTATFKKFDVLHNGSCTDYYKFILVMLPPFEVMNRIRGNNEKIIALNIALEKIQVVLDKKHDQMILTNNFEMATEYETACDYLEHEQRTLRTKLSKAETILEKLVLESWEWFASDCDCEGNSSER